MKIKLFNGIVLMFVGASAVFYGYRLMDNLNDTYKWIMSAGVVSFSVGFLFSIYALFRKMDQRALIKHRKLQQESNDSDSTDIDNTSSK